MLEVEIFMINGPKVSDMYLHSFVRNERFTYAVCYNDQLGFNTYGLDLYKILLKNKNDIPKDS